jgi:hypothetical protein
VDVHLVYSVYSTSMSSSDRMGQGERKLPDCTHKQNLVNRERESNCLEEVLTSSIALIELMLQDDSNSYIVVIVIVIVIVIYLRILMPQNVFFFSSAPLCGNNLPWVAVSPGYHLWFCH